MVEPSTDKHLFLNRELSWLAFNERVLAKRNGSLPMRASSSWRLSREPGWSSLVRVAHQAAGAGPGG